MADESTQSIVVDAPPAKIMAVIADFPAYPVWAGSVKSADVTLPGGEAEGGRAKRVLMRIENGPVRDEYELEYVWDGDREVRWHLVHGQMQKAQRGSYTMVPFGNSTEVTYHLSVDLHIPMLGMIKRKAERVIMDIALKELKRRVESLG
jgi:hypothetical protein